MSEQLSLGEPPAPSSARIGVGQDLGLITRGDASSWATFSPDERYRYALARLWEDYYTADPWERSSSALLLACCLNPSTADHREDDPTVRKLIHFAKRERCGGLVLVNIAALRSTDPKELVRSHRRGDDVVGPHNGEVIARLAGNLGMLAVVAYGRVPSPRLRWLPARSLYALGGRGARCFGTNGDGSPKHPLYLRNDTPLVPWPPRAS